MISPQHKGMSLVSLLITLTLFSGLFFAIHQWTANQRKSAVKTYQDYQALQIAENQQQRQWLSLPCENEVKQNNIIFKINCVQNRVVVRYPVGEIVLDRAQWSE